MTTTVYHEIDVLLELATDCFACGERLGLWSEIELGEEYLARRAALLAAGSSSQAPDAIPTEPKPEALSAAEPKPRRQRKESLHRLIAQAEKSGKTITSVTLADGTKFTFGDPEPGEETNPWLANIPGIKQ